MPGVLSVAGKGRDNSSCMVTVQAALQSDQGIGGLQTSNLNFERWIKHGLTAEELGNSSTLSGGGPSQGGPLPLLLTTPRYHCLLSV